MRGLAAVGYLGIFILLIGCTDNSPLPDQSREGAHRPVLTVSTNCSWRFWPALLQ